MFRARVLVQILFLCCAASLANAQNTNLFDGHTVLPVVCSSFAAISKFNINDTNSTEWQQNFRENCFKLPEGKYFKVLQRQGSVVEIQILEFIGFEKLIDQAIVWTSQKTVQRFKND